MFEIDFEWTDNNDNDRDAVLVVESLHHQPPDPTSWESPDDYYGYTDIDFYAYFVDNLEPVDLDDSQALAIIEREFNDDV